MAEVSKHPHQAWYGHRPALTEIEVPGEIIEYLYSLDLPAKAALTSETEERVREVRKVNILAVLEVCLTNSTSRCLVAKSCGSRFGSALEGQAGSESA
jgi:hypothetical protein